MVDLNETARPHHPVADTFPMMAARLVNIRHGEVGPNHKISEGQICLSEASDLSPIGERSGQAEAARSLNLPSETAARSYCREDRS